MLQYVLNNSVAFLNVLNRYQINTPLRVIHFLAQLAHESGGFKYLYELGNKAYFNKYEGRADLGNTQKGDGYKFRGRGLIQLTGRASYQAYKNYSGIDVINNPDQASTIKIALDIAGWFWKTKALNALADKNDIYSITKKINGGTNGLADRKAKLAYFKQFDVLAELKKKIEWLRNPFGRVTLNNVLHRFINSYK